MNRDLLIRIEKLENELQDLTDKLRTVSIAVVNLISEIDPEGFKNVYDKFYDDDDIVS